MYIEKDILILKIRIVKTLNIIEKYLLEDIFPVDLFKTVVASTTLASRQLTHLPNQMHKKELPIMVLVPRINFSKNNEL